MKRFGENISVSITIICTISCFVNRKLRTTSARPIFILQTSQNRHSPHTEAAVGMSLRSSSRPIEMGLTSPFRRVNPSIKAHTFGGGTPWIKARTYGDETLD